MIKTRKKELIFGCHVRNDQYCSGGASNSTHSLMIWQFLTFLGHPVDPARQYVKTASAKQ